MITKRYSQLLTVRGVMDQVAEMAAKYKQRAETIAINGTQVIFSFKSIESDPIWLLDLRRSGIPYLWMWGDDFRDFRYAAALCRTPNGVFHTQTDERSRAKAPNAERFMALKSEFRNFAFDADLVNEVIEYVHQTPESFPFALA